MLGILKTFKKNNDAASSTEWCKNISNRLQESAPAVRPKLRRGIRVPIIHIFTHPSKYKFVGHDHCLQDLHVLFIAKSLSVIQGLRMHTLTLNK